MSKLPPSISDFKNRHPAVWAAFAELGDKVHSAGPLDDKTRRLAKLGLAIGLRHEGAVHSAARQALAQGISADELYHVALLGVTTLGWPTSYAAMTWIADVVAGGGDGKPENMPE